MRCLSLLRQDLIRSPVSMCVRQASSDSSQQDIKSAFSYCVEQVRCAAASMLIHSIPMSASSPTVAAELTTTTTTYGCYSSNRQGLPNITVCYYVLAQGICAIHAGTQSSPHSNQVLQRRNWTDWGKHERNRLTPHPHAMVARRSEQRFSR